MQNHVKHDFLHILLQKCSTSVFLKLCKNVYNCVNIHDYCSSFIYYFTNFSFAPFFFLSSLGSTNSITSPLLVFFFFLRCTQTHPHTNTSTQTNQYRDTLALKKKKKQRDTQTHPHINKPKRTNNKETDWCLSERSVLDWNDQSSWVLPDQSSWVSLDRSSWVWVLLDRS